MSSPALPHTARRPPCCEKLTAVVHTVFERCSTTGLPSLPRPTPHSSSRIAPPPPSPLKKLRQAPSSQYWLPVQPAPVSAIGCPVDETTNWLPELHAT